MLVPRLVAWMLSVGMMVPGAGVVCGQDYPSKPVRIVAPGGGGSSDLTARLIAQGLPAGLGQQVIVENRPSRIAAEFVSRAAPDGYTLLAAGATVWIGPLLEKTPYDPVRDFSPITWTMRMPNILVVHPSLPAKSVKELISLAKARPGELNYASGSTGSSTHLPAELFKAMAGINIVRVNYKGAGSAISALIAGEMQLMFGTAPSVAPHVKSGRLRALAATSAQPTELAPGLPTVAASGVPGYEAASIIGIFAPAGTSATIIHRLNQEIVRLLNRADVKERFLRAGGEVVGSSPEEFAVTVKSDIAKWGKVIKDAGIRADW